MAYVSVSGGCTGGQLSVGYEMVQAAAWCGTCPELGMARIALAHGAGPCHLADQVCWLAWNEHLHSLLHAA